MQRLSPSSRKARKVTLSPINIKMPIAQVRALQHLSDTWGLREAEVVRVCVGSFFAQHERIEEQREVMILVKSRASVLGEEPSAGTGWVRKSYLLPEEQRAALLILKRDLHLSLTVLVYCIFSFRALLLLYGLDTVLQEQRP
jgi:hypothetical protein